MSDVKSTEAQHVGHAIVYLVRPDNPELSREQREDIAQLLKRYRSMLVGDALVEGTQGGT